MNPLKMGFIAYIKSFMFFNDLVSIFTKDRAYGNTRGDIGDDTAQYEHEANINLKEDASFS